MPVGATWNVTAWSQPRQDAPGLADNRSSWGPGRRARLSYEASLTTRPGFESRLPVNNPMQRSEEGAGTLWRLGPQENRKWARAMGKGLLG